MSAPLRLHYWFSRSGRAEQLRLLMAALGLDWVEVDTEWNTPAWDALAPEPLWFRAQPALVDGEFSLTQSGVILSYLARKHGIAPAGLEDAARADALAWTAEDVRMALFRATSGDRAEEKTAAFLLGEWPKRWVWGFEQALARAGTGWFVGPALTHADVAIWDALDQAREKLPGATIPADTRLAAFVKAFAEQPRIAAYLLSARRPPAE